MDDRQEAEAVHLDSIQEQLLVALRGQGIAGRSVLEIGCGTGGLLHRLLQEGAKSAIGVELSEPHLEKARARARDLGHEDRVVYLKGDFVKLSHQIGPADITILDKVLHCYHDPESLIRQSTAHTRSLYAVAFPANRPLLRVSMRLLSPILRLVLPFRVRFTPPETIRSWIRENGFDRIHQHDSESWHTEIYLRRGTDSSSTSRS